MNCRWLAPAGLSWFTPAPGHSTSPGRYGY